jgi:hypothetical protein
MPTENGQIFANKAALAEALSGCEGVIYLKGSRCHGLETLIDFDSCDLIF